MFDLCGEERVGDATVPEVGAATRRAHDHGPRQFLARREAPTAGLAALRLRWGGGLRRVGVQPCFGFDRLSWFSSRITDWVS